MANTKVPYSVTGTLSLAAGTDTDTGKSITKSMSLSGLSTSYTADQFVSVVDTLAPILVHSVKEMRVREVYTIEKN